MDLIGKAFTTRPHVQLAAAGVPFSAGPAAPAWPAAAAAAAAAAASAALLFFSATWHLQQAAWGRHKKQLSSVALTLAGHTACHATASPPGPPPHPPTHPSVCTHPPVSSSQ